MIVIHEGLSTKLSSIKELFDSKYWVGDDTQKVLLPYIKDTESLMNYAIHLYDNQGCAYIVPSFDLGFTYNTARLAGGFTSGMIVHWNSNIPFVPIDMTIKECSGSIIEIDANDIHFFTVEHIEQCLEKMWNNGYRFNFFSGNHFISLFQDKQNKKYLVMHSGDDGYRDEQNGVYPSQKVWYKDNVKVVYDKEGKRYLKYLVEDAAEKFINIALERQSGVASFHRDFANLLLHNSGLIIHAKTYQHYGMYSSHTALLGTGLVPLNETFPIFSNDGLPILIGRPSEKMWSLYIDNHRRFVIPHGWGQCINGIRGIEYLPTEKRLLFTLKSNFLLTDEIGYDKKLSKNIVKIRKLANYINYINSKSSFEECWNNNFFFDTENILFPIVSYHAENGEIIRWEI